MPLRDGFHRGWSLEPRRAGGQRLRRPLRADSPRGADGRIQL